MIASYARRDQPRVHLHPRRVRAAGRHARGGDRRGARRPATSARTSSARAHSLSLVVHRGAGAYICGEETGLLDSLEGKRGNPRLKPPFPAIQGLYQGPTLINNVETLAHRAARSSRWAARSTRSSASRPRPARSSSRSPAHVQRPGNYEIELGIPSREIIYGLAGGPPEGRSGQVLVPRRLLLAGADRRRPRPPLRLRHDGQGRLDARLGRDHRRRRLDADPRRRDEGREVLLARVLRQVHALPRGHQLDGEDARADRRRRGDADGPRHHGLRAGAHHRQLPVRARRRDGDADRLDDRQVPRRVRGDIEEARLRNGATAGPVDGAESALAARGAH